MAGTQVNLRTQGRPGSEDLLYVLAVQVNKLVNDVETLRAGLDAVCDILDADAGVSATNLASTAAVATAGTMTASKIGDRAGTVLS